MPQFEILFLLFKNDTPVHTRACARTRGAPLLKKFFYNYKNTFIDTGYN